MNNEFDNVQEFTRKDTEKKLPLGWLILYFGLIAWGVFYFFSYTPIFSGWTQAGELKEEMKVKGKR